MAFSNKDVRLPKNYLNNKCDDSPITGSFSLSCWLEANDFEAINGTQGSVMFIGADGSWTEDNANLFYDDTNDRLGIGNNTPSHTLDTVGNVEMAYDYLGGGEGLFEMNDDWGGLGAYDAIGQGSLLGTELVGVVSGIEKPANTPFSQVFYFDIVNGDFGEVDVRKDSISILYNDGTDQISTSHTIADGFKIDWNGDFYNLPKGDGNANEVLTTNGAGQVSWQPAGGGIQTFSVTIPAAQVLTANTNPITLVAAQGARTFIELISCTGRIDFNTTPYATNTSGEIRISGAAGYLIEASSFFNINKGSDYLAQFVIGQVTDSISNVENSPLIFTINGGNPTAGDSDITIYGTYRVVNI